MAALIDVGPRTVQSLARQGLIPATRIGDLDDWLFDPDDVVAVLKGYAEKTKESEIAAIDR